MGQKKISIREIAKLSGVSVATVSRVINNNGRFSEETRQRVLNVIHEQGYETNAIAKGLRMQKTNTIGIVVPDLNNSFFSDLVEKIESQFFTAGYSTIICDTARDAHKESIYLKMLESKLVDGIVVISGLSEFDSKQLSRRIPIVCIDRKPNAKDIFFIGSNHYKGAKLATEELIKSGTNPVILMGSRESTSSRDRLKGFKDTLIENGLNFDSGSIFQLTNQQDETIDGRRTAIRQLLRNKMMSGISPLGIFAVSDTLAADILFAAHSLYVSIPNDLKVIGFDDSPIARYCYPELTTIHQDTDTIAQDASTYLISAIQGDKVHTDSVKLVDVSLVKRNTV
ncbi:LacI family DNA-binding transcriptional regulator [Companilactobacillus huachuanensis]|uniref:LacI family DNA-binding transcriptional regulator n=1 Tax=Companilactobacillus huachuanensis TaxID=2559914 RepID=A0ABW1RNU6_9LACO|nr:LacI family DNA-binding transcriptional regulator [Companilactobacillus huachuanensis]